MTRLAQISLLVIAAAAAIILIAGCDAQSTPPAVAGDSTAAPRTPCCPGHGNTDAAAADASPVGTVAVSAVETPATTDTAPVTRTEDAPAASIEVQPKENTVTEQPKTDENPAPAGNPRVKMETSKGTMIIELYPDKAPITVKNFLAYVDSGFYADTIFHRVIADFMLQGGGFTKDMNQKATLPQIKNEAKNGLKNERGTLSMARTAAVDSATSQFFINLKHNEFLDHGVRDYGYAVFAKVVEGMDVVDAIGKVPTRTIGHYSDVPAEAVIIKSVTRVEAAK